MRFKKRAAKKPIDLDITSLLDILVILLVFLLRSYNASDLQLEVAKGIELANSGSPRLGEQAIVLQIDAERNLYLNNKKIFNIGENKSSDIPFLLSELKKHAEEKASQERQVASQLTVNQDDPKKKKRLPINLVFDKRLPFQLVQKVLHTASLAGHNQYKLIVQGNAQ